MRAFSTLDRENETFVPSVRVYADGETEDNSFSLKYRSNWTPGRFNSTGAKRNSGTTPLRIHGGR